VRVYDTEIEFKTGNGSVEISEYHDERHGTIGPHRWNARVVLIEDGGIDIVNINRNTQQELYQALEQVEDLFEAAKTAVLEPTRS
jgi:hypothetical protein